MVRKTVFIVGAGASKEYSIPLNSELVGKIQIGRDTFGKYFNAIPEESQWKPDREEIDQFFTAIGNLQAEESIDYWIYQNSQFSDIARTMVSFVIHHYEGEAFGDQRLLAKEGWLKVLFKRINSKIAASHPITRLEDIDLSEYLFLTFNYDRLIEYYLAKAIKSFYAQITQDCSYEEIISKCNINVHHIYGLSRPIGDRPSIDKPPNVRMQVYHHRNSIRLIRDDAVQDKHYIQSSIAEAARIYILGFAFDSKNCQVLGFPDTLQTSSRMVLATTLELRKYQIVEIKREYGFQDSHLFSERASTFIDQNFHDIDMGLRRTIVTDDPTSGQPKVVEY